MLPSLERKETGILIVLGGIALVLLDSGFDLGTSLVLFLAAAVFWGLLGLYADVLVRRNSP